MEPTSALVTPDVMKWARERARLDVDTAAKKLGRPPEDIRGWEDGTIVPSMAQARKASEVYKRSLAVFYLPEPSKDFDTLKEQANLWSGVKLDELSSPRIERYLACSDHDGSQR